MERAFVGFSRWLLRRRYRFHVKGLDRKDLPRKGVLLMPNHVSLLDPTIVQMAGWDTFRARPLVTNRYINNKELKGLFSWLKAIGIPDFFVAKNNEKLRQLDETFDELLEALNQGDNVLFYPSGRLKTEGNERVRGTSGLHRLLKENPHIKTVVVRTTGLWGSSFSSAPHGRTPDLIKIVSGNLLAIIKNLLFFMPKRDVHIEFCPIEIPQGLSRMDLALFLEDFYNRPFGDEGEHFHSVPYHFLSKKTLARVPTFPPIEGGDPQLLDEVTKLVKEVSGQKVTHDTHLLHDLSMDSLEITELYTDLETKYGLKDLYSSELCTPRYIVSQIEGRWRSNRHKAGVEKLNAFKDSAKALPIQKTPLAEFLTLCDKYKKHPILFDPQEGALTYGKIAKRIRSYMCQFQGKEEIHLLLEEGADSLCATVAAHLLGKKPTFLKEGNIPGYFTTHKAIYHMHGVNTPQKPTYLEILDTKNLPPVTPLDQGIECQLFESLQKGIPYIVN